MWTSLTNGPEHDRGRRYALPLMALTVFIDLAAFALVLPMLPFWAERFGAGPFAIGMLLAAYSVTQFIFTPILGGLSDRVGRRPVIVAALLLEAAGLVGTAIAGSVAGLLVARAIGGIGGSSIGSAQAVVADVTEPRDRARGMGIIGAAIGLGFVVGPVVGGALTLVGPAVPFWVAAVLVVAAALLVVRLLPETRGSRDPSTGGARRGGIVPSPGAGVASLIAVTLLATLAFAAMETVFPLFTQDRYGWGPVQNGVAFAFIGAIMVVIQGGVVGRGARRFGERRLLVGGLAMLAAGLALLPVGHLVAWLMIASAVVAMGIAIVNPTTSALLSLVSAPAHQGGTLGLARSAGSLGRIVGPAVAGTLFARFGGGAPFVLGATLGFGAAALLLVGPTARAVAVRVPADRRRAEEAGRG